MEQIIMAGKPVAEEIRRNLREKFAGRDLTLATFLVGDNPAAHVYKRSLLKTAASLGIHTRDVELPEGASQEEAERALRALSEDPRVDGILPLVPFPRHISRMQLIRQLDPEKDMDCIHPINGGKLYLGITPWGPLHPPILHGPAGLLQDSLGRAECGDGGLWRSGGTAADPDAHGPVRYSDRVPFPHKKYCLPLPGRQISSSVQWANPT